MKQIRESKFSKIVAYYLIMMMLLQVSAPMQMYALTSGPKQPEFTAFTPISTSDMVDLSSGDFNYNIPIMDVGGYPINLAYNSGATMDQEASWVGLGWNLNVGQIERQVRGLPDDFKGDPMTYKNNLRDNVTVGTHFNVNPAVFGANFPFSLGLGVEYNNTEGVSFKPSIGMSMSLAGQSTVGFTLSGSTTEGASLSPSFSFDKKIQGTTKDIDLKGSVGATLSSRKGLENIDASCTYKTTTYTDDCKTDVQDVKEGAKSGSVSFNNTNNYTPTKRVGYLNINKSFNATLGAEIIGAEAQMKMSGYGAYQKIDNSYLNRTVGGYGYENTHLKGGREGVLDFNRENERIVNKNTTALPVTNYTFDTYNIQGQGVSGMFRPYRSQVSYVYNDNVSDFSSSGAFGAEIGVGGLVHGGIDFKVSPTISSTGPWFSNNHSVGRFRERSNGPLIQPVTFKLVGELGTDSDATYHGVMEDTKAMRLGLSGGPFNWALRSKYQTRDGFNHTYTTSENDAPIIRSKRLLKNQVVQKISNKLADNIFIFKNNAPSYHTAGIKVMQTDGTSYIYGQAVYNTKKVESTFDVSGASIIDREKDLVTYSSADGSNSNSNSDHFLNKIITPKYAHTYLITSILSSDYEDLDNNGPTDLDLGGYTKFEYISGGQYNWRVPYGLNQASFSEGLKTSAKDQKGSYIYGEKELKYLSNIETKTHIAFFELKNRDDAVGVVDENGGMQAAQRMKYISAIRLYSKAELSKNSNGKWIDPLSQGGVIKPIKTAHFEYDYSLCPGIPSKVAGQLPGTGKLTLKKVYFTYRNSKMGKFTPYVFTYANNKTYHKKAFDIWGNYKPIGENESGLNNTEFPFVSQDKTTDVANTQDDTVAAGNTSAWTLQKIGLPSGGEIKITTESDDYKYVQNKKAMQMFKVCGVGNDANPTTNKNLFNFSTPNDLHVSYIYVKIPDQNISAVEFRRKYLSENLFEPIYFKASMNMVDGEYEYVTGYFEIDTGAEIRVTNGIASIPMVRLNRDGGIGGRGNVNPLSKAGWGFGRTYLNRKVYGMGDESNKSFISICKELVNSIAMMAEIFTGPNGMLEIKGRARRIEPEKSWVRLENPTGKKFGGGLRVKKIELSDNWDVMNGLNPLNDNPIYKEMYGQEFNYNLTDNTSSGVATFESNSSPENPFTKPFYAKDGRYSDKIASPKENNYVELPFGESFFPSPKITYSRVSVSNLNKNDEVNHKTISKHATGKVISKFYTSYDFPTKVDYTSPETRIDPMDGPLFQLLKVFTYNSLTMSQGFSVETNDMNGKIRSESVYNEGEENDESFISRVEYKYNADANNKLYNNLTTIDEKGNIGENTIGVEYDVINDFNQSNSTTIAMGFDGNVAAFLLGIIPGVVPAIFPSLSFHKSLMRTATTTKVVHKTGILIEKIAYDGNSRVSTKNLAWDSKSGEVLLTQTINEFDDKYYSFSYPAYWYYSNMGMASENIDLEGELVNSSTGTGASKFYLNGSAIDNVTKYFKLGDELLFGNNVKVWVSSVTSNGIELMDREGKTLTNSDVLSNLNFIVLRSGNKNMQMADMANVTSMANPLETAINGKIINPFSYYDTSDPNGKVINASAIEYSDDWKSQCENNLPNENGKLDGKGDSVNPFLYNTKGEWRAVKSYAYLSGRNNFETTNRRKTGYFKKFSTFYNVDELGAWSINNEGWTYASAVTKYSPYGLEIENADALDRYSSAQYGYQYKLPIAVTSNSKYQEMGADNFEDYSNDLNPAIFKPHFAFSQVLTGNTIYVTNKKSHSGQKSMAVLPGHKATFTRKLEACKPKGE